MTFSAASKNGLTEQSRACATIGSLRTSEGGCHAFILSVARSRPRSTGGLRQPAPPEHGELSMSPEARSGAFASSSDGSRQPRTASLRAGDSQGWRSLPPWSRFLASECFGDLGLVSRRRPGRAFRHERTHRLGGGVAPFLWRRLDHADCRRRTSAVPRQGSSGPDLAFTFARARAAGADGLPMRGKLACQRPRPPSWERGTSRLSTRLDPTPAARRRTYVNRSRETTRTSSSTPSMPRA